MKTDDLKEKGLTEEQINFVMQENGKDLKVLQDDNATLKAEKLQLENDKKVLEKEKGDKEKALDELQKNTITKEEHYKKVKEIEDNAKKEKADYIFDQLLKDAFKEAKVRNTENNIKAVKGALDMSKIATDKDGKTIIGLKEQLDAIKKSDPHFFETQVDGNQPNEPGGNGGKGDEGPQVSSGSNFAKRNNEVDKAEQSQFFN